jgi:hypothetical protein
MSNITKLFRRMPLVVLVLGLIAFFACTRSAAADTPTLAATPEIAVWPQRSSNQLWVARETAQPFYIMVYRRGAQTEEATEVEITAPANWQIWRGSDAPPTAKETALTFRLPLTLRATSDQAGLRDYRPALAAGNLLMVARPQENAQEGSLRLRWLQGDSVLAEHEIALKMIALPNRFVGETKMAVGMWLNDPKFHRQTMDVIYRSLRRSGVDYIVITREMFRQNSEMLRELGVRVLIGQWWDFRAYMPQSPPADAVSTLKDGSIDRKRWQPTYMAEGGEEFLKGIAAIADELKGMEGVSGFMLDYEPGDVGLDADYSERSHQLFERSLGKKIENWPADVLGGGQHEAAWIDFRVRQSEEYVAWFRKIFRERAPQLHLAVSTSGATGLPTDLNRRLAATDIVQFSSHVDTIHPQLYSWAAKLPAQQKRFDTILALGQSTVLASRSKVFPIIGAASGGWELSNPQYLRTQVLDLWLQGANGFEIWQYFYGVDGRYLALVNEMAQLCAEAGDKPAAKDVDRVFSVAETETLRTHYRKAADGKTAWGGVFNLSPKSVRVKVQIAKDWEIAPGEQALVSVAPFSVHLIKCRLKGR